MKQVVTEVVTYLNYLSVAVVSLVYFKCFVTLKMTSQTEMVQNEGQQFIKFINVDYQVGKLLIG